MKKCLISCAFSLIALLPHPALASSWNYIDIGLDDAKYFFDADTVVKSKNVVIVWIKTVQVSEANGHGSWSIAARSRMDCEKKTTQTLAASAYDVNGKFIEAYNTPATENAVIPDSKGDLLLKAACDPTFPNDKSQTKYFKIKNNDVFQATKDIVEYEKAYKASAPQ